MLDYEENKEEDLVEEEAKKKSSTKTIIFIIILVSVASILVTAIVLVFMYWSGDSNLYNPYKVSNINKGKDKYLVSLVNRKDSIGENEFKKLTVEITAVHDHLLNVKINATDHPRWEVAKALEDLLPNKEHVIEDVNEYIKIFQHYSLEEMNLDILEDPFSWKILGAKTQKLDKDLVDTYKGQLQFFEEHIIYEMTLPCKELFGLPQASSKVLLKEGTYTFWNRYKFEGNKGEEGVGGINFLMCMIKEESYVGIFMDSSNAHTVSIEKENERAHLKYQMAGGIIDLKVFHVGDPLSIIKIFHGFIGKPVCPPFWSFGFGQSKENCENTEAIEKGVNFYLENKIPLDSIWMDQLLMNNYSSFTVDSIRYNGLAEKVDDWNRKGINFVQTFLPQLKVNSDIYNSTINNGVFITDSKDNTEPLITKGKNTEDCGFMDLLTNKSWSILNNSMEKLKKGIGYNGLWIRQESPYTICNGPCGVSGFDYEPVPLQNNTINLLSYYNYSANSIHFNVHNLYSLLNAIAISKASQNKENKLRITSSVASPRLGHYSTLWRGNVNSTWETLKQIIAETISYNMAGIPFVGYPVCGYSKVEYDLCLRWYQLATYLPEMRLHHDETSNKEPREEAFQKAIKQRYKIARFLYTKVYEAEIWGGTIWEPLAFVFPKDPDTYKESVIENTFMIGRTLYVAPKIVNDKSNIKVYLPNWNWYSLHNYNLINEFVNNGKGKEIEVPVSDDYTNVFIKGGKILPIQNEYASNTKELEEHPVTLIVAPDHDKKARGTMIVSDDNNFDIEGKRYSHYSFTYIDGMFRSNIIEGYTYEKLKPTELLKEIIILDKSLHNIKYACALTSDLQFHNLEVKYEAERLTISTNNNLKVYLKNIDSITFGENIKSSLCARRTIIDYVRKLEREANLLVNSSNGALHDTKFVLLSERILYLSMEPTEGEKWKTEEVLVEGTRNRKSDTGSLQGFSLSIARPGQPFGFSIYTPGSHHVLSTKGDFYFEGDRFIKFDLTLNSDKVYGLGERIAKFELGDGVYTLFCKSQKSFVEDNKFPGKNMYGAHPFYMFHNNDALFSGVFILTTNPLDVVIHTEDTKGSSKKTLTHIIGSSILELFFIQDGPPNQVIAEYHSLIGKPVLIPYWSFGYHQSRWGYNHINILKEVVDNFTKKNVPLDVIWNDIDYMVEYQDFTLDTDRYKEMDTFINELKSKNIMYVPILDAGIARKDSYAAYKDGLDKDLYIKSSITKEPLVGIVWPGFAVFTDFTHPSANDYWIKHLKELHKVLPFDGIWLDMNEPTNFCDGECPDEIHYTEKEFTTDKDDMFVYYIGHKKLNDITVSLDAIRHNGVSEYNLHNLYGLHITRAVNKYFEDVEKRPFIISRSTFPGLGRYGGHWLGDNYSDKKFMHYSISGIYNFQMFGIPFVGTDVCGFAGQADIELCKRWMQLGAFYPFYRNHKEIDSGVQEPYIDTELAAISTHAIKTRYRLSRYLYSQYFDVSLNGGAFFTPLFWYFPDDKQAYNHNEDTFLLGPHLKVSPCFAVSDEKPIKSYFPNTDWYEVFTGHKIMTKGNLGPGKLIELQCTLKEEPVLNVHIAGGSIIPLGKAGENLALTLKNPIDLIVVPIKDTAKGTFYYDDDKVDTIKNEMYQKIEVVMGKRHLNFTSTERKFGYTFKDNIISVIKIYNAATYENTKQAKIEYNDGKISNELEVEYDKKYAVLSITLNDDDDVGTIKTITWND